MTAPSCPTCGGPGVPLGSLGDREHFRCRNCGWTYSRAAAHKRVPRRTLRLAGGQTRAPAVCVCGWSASWPRTQAQAADAYRSHKISEEETDGTD